MKFHEYKFAAVKYGLVAEDCPAKEAYDQIAMAIMHPEISQFPPIPDDVYAWIRDNALFVLTEWYFLNDKRPFYNVYPAVTECLKNTSLDFRLDQIQPSKEAIAICFSEGNEFVHQGVSVESIVVHLTHTAVNQDGSSLEVPCLAFVASTKNGGFFQGAVFGKKDTIPEIFSKCEANSNQAKNKSLFSIAVGILLLAQDERFVEPILLKRDQGKNLNQEQLEKAIGRAKRNGINGKTIGKHLEISPHMRRPHFAIRWTGKGGTIPRLTPIKGCVISRDKMYPIPTGYMDKDSQELESV